MRILKDAVRRGFGPVPEESSVLWPFLRIYASLRLMAWEVTYDKSPEERSAMCASLAEAALGGENPWSSE